MTAYLRAIQVKLPAGRRTNADLLARNPGWEEAKILAKTGIRARRIAAPTETASDLGARAARRLLDRAGIDRGQIDALIYCSQSPDFPLPATACLLQDRLGLPRGCGALDVNLGCSAFPYALWLSHSLVTSRAARSVLVIVADTYSRYCDPHDLSTVTLFGDGAAAALIGREGELALAELGPTIVGTDGRGAENLIVRGGGARASASGAEPGARPTICMNGPEIVSFTLTTVRSGIQALLDRVGWSWDEVDLFLLHQANRFLLERLRAQMKLPEKKLPIDLDDIGNTAGAALPIHVGRCLDRGLLRPGMRCVLAGFGVGYSWGMTALTWVGERITPC